MRARAGWVQLQRVLYRQAHRVQLPLEALAHLQEAAQVLDQVAHSQVVLSQVVLAQQSEKYTQHNLQ